VLRFYLSRHHVIVYSNIFCRLDALMAGALIALAVRSEGFQPAKFVKTAWVVFLASVPFTFVSPSFPVGWIVFSLTTVTFASFVYLALFSKQRWFQSALKNRFLVYTGTISYGLYLLQKLPFDVAQSFHVDRYPLLTLPVGLAACYAAAALSWNFLEKPFQNLKRFFPTKSSRILSAPQGLTLVSDEPNLSI
jgi:peptidoglycan/LPS O-acetylase OafA/YrhL